MYILAEKLGRTKLDTQMPRNCCTAFFENQSGILQLNLFTWLERFVGPGLAAVVPIHHTLCDYHKARINGLQNMLPFEWESGGYIMQGRSPYSHQKTSVLVFRIHLAHSKQNVQHDGKGHSSCGGVPEQSAHRSSRIALVRNWQMELGMAPKRIHQKEWEKFS